MNALTKPETWPAARVTMRSVDELLPYARNARTHTDEQVAQIAASIAEFGWTVPILVDTSGQIIAGHGRLMAARKLGLSKVPVMVADGWTDTQRRAYAIADNQLALKAGWDDDLLRLELQDLDTGEIDLSLTGFSFEELEQMLAPVVFEPGTEEEQGKLDQLEPKYVSCPHCGKEFDLREQV